MNVSLTPELNEFVTTKVATGRYTSASEVVREALRLLEERDRERGARLAAFHGEISTRLDSLDRGEHTSPAAAKARLERRSQQRRHQPA